MSDAPVNAGQDAAARLAQYRGLFKERDYDAALAVLQAAIAAFGIDGLGEPEARLRLDLGVLYLRTGRPAEGEREVRRAVELDPGNARAHVKLATALARLRRPEEAIPSYRTALALYRAANRPETANVAARLQEEEERLAAIRSKQAAKRATRAPVPRRSWLDRLLRRT